MKYLQVLNICFDWLESNIENIFLTDWNRTIENICLTEWNRTIENIHLEWVEATKSSQKPNMEEEKRGNDQ